MNYTDTNTWILRSQLKYIVLYIIQPGCHLVHEHTSSAMWWSSNWPLKALTDNFSKRCASWLIATWKSSCWMKQSTLPSIAHRPFKSSSQTEWDHIATEESSNSIRLTDTFHFYFSGCKTYFCTPSSKEKHWIEARQTSNHIKWKPFTGSKNYAIAPFPQPVTLC